MYFAKYLKVLGWEPIVITVAEKAASYPMLDHSLLREVDGIRVVKTGTREPLKFYSKLISGSSTAGIPQGEVNTQSFLGKCAAYIRGNFFIPDARKGWVPYAIKAAQACLKEEKISHLITTGPPHSTHLAGLQLKKQFDLNWWVDFRDPWSDVFYNRQMKRSKRSESKDQLLEKRVLQTADGVITTTGADLHTSLKTKAPKQQYIALPNGYDAALIASVKGTQPLDAFHLVYTGLLTQQQAYTSIIQALQAIQTERPIRFSLAGNISPSIIATITDALPNIEVIYHGYLDHAAAIRLMKSGHLLLNFIFDGASTQMISGKLLEYFATEVPVLSLGEPNSSAGAFIEKGSCAKMIQKEDISSIQNFIKGLYEMPHPQKNSMDNLTQWSREALTERLINQVLS